MQSLLLNYGMEPSATVEGAETLSPEEETLCWAQVEFGQAQLGDKRRTARLVQLARVLGGAPAASLPHASGDAATLKAAYRFFDNDGVAPQALLESHQLATYERLRHVPMVLAPQDTCLIDWTEHPATTGIGPLATPNRFGFLVHSTLALTPERVPLGLLDQQVWSRDPHTYGQLEPHAQRDIEDKESFKWLRSLEQLNQARQACPQTHFVSIGDRESDVYDLFLVPRAPGVDLLVRSAWDRRVKSEPSEPASLREQVAQAPVATTLVLELPARPAPRGTSPQYEGGAKQDGPSKHAGGAKQDGPSKHAGGAKQDGSSKHAGGAKQDGSSKPQVSLRQPARSAQVSVRWCPVTLRPPRKRQHQGLPEVALWAVLVQEEAPPAGVSRLEWLLLTSCPVYEASQAVQRVEWYACRWSIEVWHKVLKSGCGIENRQLESAARLERCLALYSVIAWRILYGVMLAREVPDAPCTALLEEDEWQALHCRLHQTSQPPEQPMSLREAVRGIAKLGGFLGRKSDGEPGITVLWRGFQQLREVTTMYQIMRDHAKTSPPRKRCG